MARFISFFRSNSRIICAVLFVLSFALFFIPISSPERYPLEYSPYIMTRLFIQHSDAGASYAFAILFMFIVLWALEIVAFLVSKKSPFLFVWAIFPFSVIFFGTIYLVAVVFSTASASVYIMSIMYAFFLCAVIATIAYRAPAEPKPERNRKPSKAERIAELEARVRELEDKERGSD